jgi:hypothetical protein
MIENESEKEYIITTTSTSYKELFRVFDNKNITLETADI